MTVESERIEKAPRIGIQDEIAFLKKQAWNAGDPVLKFHLYRDLIASGLQAVDDADFRAQIAEDLRRLNFDEEAYWARYSQGYPVETVERVLYSERLNDVTIIWSKVAAKLRELGVLAAGTVAPKGVSEEGHPKGERNAHAPGFWKPANYLLIASAILLTSNVLLMVAAILGALGSAPGGLGAGLAAYIALGMDLFGVGFLVSFLWGRSRQLDGNRRRPLRLAGFLLLAWVGLTVIWRYVLPAVIGTEYQSLLFDLMSVRGTVPPEIAQNIGLVNAFLGLWVVSAALFVAAHILIGLDRFFSQEWGWTRELPVTAWLAAALLSLTGTVLLVHSIASQLAGGPVGSFFAGVVLKLVIAPNIFISAYAGSLRLSRHTARARGPDPVVDAAPQGES